MNLTKGESLNLTKAAPTLTKVTAGAGWDVAANGPSMDLDLVAFMLTQGKLAKDQNFIYFGNKTSPCGSVASSGDNLTGVGEGDDETLSIDLSKVPADVDQIDIAVSIYQAKQKGQSLKSLQNAHVRIVNTDGNAEMAKFNITNFDNAEANFVLGSLKRDSAEWTFVAVGEPKQGELQELVNVYKAAA